MVILSVDISIDIAIAIPQSVQTQKVVINTLVYLVYGYYKDSLFLVIEVILLFSLYFSISLHGNFVYNFLFVTSLHLIHIY